VGWAFGYAAKTFQENRDIHWYTSGSQRHHYFSAMYIYNQINGGVDSGAFMEDAANLLLNQGCNTLDLFDPSDYLTQPSNEIKADAIRYKIK
jgi:hypothetical protein